MMKIIQKVGLDFYVDWICTQTVNSEKKKENKVDCGEVLQERRAARYDKRSDSERPRTR